METPPQAPEPAKPESTLTVSGVTFTARQVVSAVVKIDGREIYIQKKEEEKPVGFKRSNQ